MFLTIAEHCNTSEMVLLLQLAIISPHTFLAELLNQLWGHTLRVFLPVTL